MTVGVSMRGRYVKAYTVGDIGYTPQLQTQFNEVFIWMNVYEFTQN